MNIPSLLNQNKRLIQCNYSTPERWFYSQIKQDVNQNLRKSTFVFCQTMRESENTDWVGRELVGWVDGELTLTDAYVKQHGHSEQCRSEIISGKSDYTQRN